MKRNSLKVCLPGRVLVLWLALTTVLPLLPIPSVASDLDGYVEGIERHYNRPETMQLAFEQTYAGMGRPPRTEEGMLYLRKPRRMRWEYTEPEGKLFLSDGKDVYFYSPLANRVEKSKLKESGDMRTPLAFLMGRLDLRRDFREFRYKKEGEDLHLTAYPKSKKAPYSEVVFLVTPDYRIRRLIVAGQDQSRMEFNFSGEKSNPALKEDLFQFQVPAGAELVEMSEETDESP